MSETNKTTANQIETTEPRARRHDIAEKYCANFREYISLRLRYREKRERYLEENEFKFIVSSAIDTVHGEFANQIDVLKFTPIDKDNYNAIIRFSSNHRVRVVTSLLLYPGPTDTELKFEQIEVAPTPCLFVK